MTALRPKLPGRYALPVLTPSRWRPFCGLIIENSGSTKFTLLAASYKLETPY